MTLDLMTRWCLYWRHWKLKSTLEPGLQGFKDYLV
jgi:hypothetical protein